MIYIFDLLGIHCGMHYYDLAFVDLLESHGYKCRVLSNYEEKGISIKFFPNFFKGGKLYGIMLFAYAYLKFPLFLLFHRKEKIIYLAYGEIHEIPFLLSLILAKNVYIDVHEVHALRYKDDSIISKIFRWVYQHLNKDVIIHSDRTKEILSQSNMKKLYVPHFRYAFPKNYNCNNLAKEVKESFRNCSNTRYLFFGNLSLIKGIDVVLDVFSDIKDNTNFELVVAGKNVDNVDMSLLYSDKITIIDRHINDDELVYLYSHTDFVLLPYKKSSQSGIFAMSAYFHKPMIMSDIPFFRNMIDEYPSFGYISSIEEYKKCVLRSMDDNKKIFFTQDDCDRFEFKKEFDSFIKDLL